MVKPWIQCFECHLCFKYVDFGVDVINDCFIDAAVNNLGNNDKPLLNYLLSVSTVLAKICLECLYVHGDAYKEIRF